MVIYLDIGPDDLCIPGGQRVVLWPLNKLEVAHRRKLQAQVLQGLCTAVHHSHVHDDIILVYRDVSLSVDRIRETRQLQYAVEAL